MTDAASFAAAFPSVRDIEDEALRSRVATAWADAVASSEYDGLHEVPWWPPHEAVVGEHSLVDHVRAVTRTAVGITDSLGEQLDGPSSVRRDIVIAGALVHDISKLFEMTGRELVESHDLLPHPHYSVHLLADAGFSKDVIHVALAHSDRSGVAPRTIEAEIVSVADRLAVDELYWERTGDIYS